MDDSPDNLSRLQLLFERALELDGVRRGAFLDRECAGLPGLRERIDALLLARLCAPLATPLLEGGPAHNTPEDLLGQWIGEFRLTARLGEGGFAEVFLAEQVSPVRRLVALKIIRPGMDSRSVLARFEQERQTLALMSHPNIAQVFDAGASSRGRPYFVMEHIAGARITEFCSQERLSLPQRIRIFIDVCLAVQHAHTKGVIHRDLKPSNILVSMVDGKPVPKVIDFGIAKALGPAPSDSTAITELGQFIGTPEYMSPEQMSLRPDAVDTRSDVYSLGTVLYEVLTGGPPFDAQSLRGRGFDELRRTIRETDPPTPRTRLAGRLAESARLHEHDRTRELEALSRHFRPDLEWVVLKAIRKVPAERYASPKELADDLERYLRNDAVLAGPESRVYRLRKALARNRGAALACGAVVAALVLGVAGVLAHSQRVRLERDAARFERDRAVAAEATASAVTEFMVNSMLLSDPNEGGRHDATVSQAMTRASELLESGSLAAQPAACVRLWRVIAMILDGNGRSGEALAPAERAARLARTTAGVARAELAECLSTQALVLESLGRYEAALKLHEESLICVRDGGPGDGALVARMTRRVAGCLDRLGRLDEALGLYQRSLELQREADPTSIDVASVLSDTGAALMRAGRLADAEPVLREALRLRQAKHRGDHPACAGMMNNLGRLLIQRGALGEAESLLRDSLAMHERLFDGPQHQTLANLDNLGLLLHEKGCDAEAADFYQRSLVMAHRLFGDKHPSVASSLANLAQYLVSVGHWVEAESMARHAADIYLDLGLSNDVDLPGVLNVHARALRALQRYEEAESRYELALEIRRSMTAGDDGIVAMILNNIATVRLMSGRAAEAEPMYEEALAINQRLQPEGGIPVAWCLYNLASTRHRLGRLQDAEDLYRRALEMRQSIFPDGHRSIAENLCDLALCLDDLGRRAEAAELSRQSLEMAQRVLEPDDPLFIRIRESVQSLVP